MMKYEKKGLLNQHLKITNDSKNLTNQNNAHLYSEILNGHYDSNAFNYLLNMGYTRFSDVKSIGMYNNLNLASEINESRYLDEIKNETTITLPSGMVKEKINIYDVLEKRQSNRIYSDYIMKIINLSIILKYSFGISNRQMNYGNIKTQSRYYGSGGGLYPVEVYLLINRVEKIPKGIYKYQPYSHSLLPIQTDMDIDKLLEYGDFDFDNYSFCVLYKYDFNKNYLKYGELSLFTTFAEIGIMSQNFELVCTSRNYTACQVAGFDKKYAESCLRLDGINSHILYVNMCGKY